MNVNNFDLLYRERVTAPGITGSSVIMKTERINPGRIRVLTHVSIENKTSAYTKCRLSIYNGAIEFLIDEAIFPAAGELLVHPKDILLGEGDILRATLTGTTTSDELELHAIGWEMPRE
jgi:hypothetical protein